MGGPIFPIYALFPYFCFNFSNNYPFFNPNLSASFLLNLSVILKNSNPSIFSCKRLLLPWFTKIDFVDIFLFF